MNMILNEDIAVNVAVAQARAFERDDDDRHLEKIGELINQTEDPVNTARKVARKCGRKLASIFLDPQIVNAGARGWYKP